LSDSHYVFPTLARPFLSLNLALSGRFVRLANFCFKTPAGIKILPGNITFCSLAHVAWQLYFWGERGFEVAQDTIF